MTERNIGALTAAQATPVGWTLQISLTFTNLTSTVREVSNCRSTV
jgi:hypothetical protein